MIGGRGKWEGDYNLKNRLDLQSILTSLDLYQIVIGIRVLEIQVIYL